jgi:CRP-like cAMP-binding protein
MAVNPKTLYDMPLFGDMDADALAKISSLMTYTKVQEGELLTQRGQAAHTFYVILSGNFLISFTENRAFTLHEKGQIMGWSSVVTPFRYTGTAVALTRGEVLCLSSDAFRELLIGDARISELLMKKLNIIVSERMPYFIGTKRTTGS